MKNLLKKEIVDKTTVGMQILSAVLSSIMWSIIIYICLTTLRQPIINILTSINDGKINAKELTIIFFPAILILLLVIKAAFFVTKINKNIK